MKGVMFKSLCGKILSQEHLTHPRKAGIHLKADLSTATPQSMLQTESCSIFSCLHCRRLDISMSNAWCNRSVRIHLLQTQTHPQLSEGFISYSRSGCFFFWLMSEASWNNMFWFFFFFPYVTRWLIRDKWSSLWHSTNWARAFQHRGFYSGKFKTRATSLWRGSKGFLKLTLSWGNGEITTKNYKSRATVLTVGVHFNFSEFFYTYTLSVLVQLNFLVLFYVNCPLVLSISVS